MTHLATGLLPYLGSRCQKLARETRLRVVHHTAF